MSVARPARYQRAIVPSPVLAMLLFLFTEVMLFCALISAYVVLRGQAGAWPPIGQPRLPVIATGINSVLLVVSGPLMWKTVAAAREGDRKKLLRLLWSTFALSTAFVAIQGAEWASLISYGLTSSSSLYGSLFYTVIGCHGLHVVAALIALGVVLRTCRQGGYGVDNHDGLLAMRLYWAFVVAVWPPLYALVYLW